MRWCAFEGYVCRWYGRREVIVKGSSSIHFGLFSAVVVVVVVVSRG